MGETSTSETGLKTVGYRTTIHSKTCATCKFLKLIHPFDMDDTRDYFLCKLLYRIYNSDSDHHTWHVCDLHERREQPE